MFYKEWRTARFKFLIGLALYTLAAVALLLGWNFKQFSDPNLLDSWRDICLYITLGGAAIFGLDLISEEKDKGTLSFLLTRPISRSRIYSTKIVINIAALIGPCALISPVIFFFNQFRIPADRIYNPLGDFTTLMWFWMIGALVICLSGLVSVYTQNFVQTFFFTALGMGILTGIGGLLLTWVSKALTDSIWPDPVIPNLYHSSIELGLLIMLGPIILPALVTAALYYGGKTAFTRKSF